MTLAKKKEEWGWKVTLISIVNTISCMDLKRPNSYYIEAYITMLNKMFPELSIVKACSA
jgi:hypothetical protein